MENAAGLALSVKPFSAMRAEPTCGIWPASGTAKSSSASCYNMKWTSSAKWTNTQVTAFYSRPMAIPHISRTSWWLPEQKQGILILHCVLELTDDEIDSLVEMSRSAVQRHRTKTPNELRKRLEEKRSNPK